MAGTNFKNGLKVAGSWLCDASKYIYQVGVKVTSTAAELNKLDGVNSTTAELNLLYLQTVAGTTLNKMAAKNTVTAVAGGEGDKACVTNGVSAIAGATGLADLTLAAPSLGDEATIRIDTLSSGSVVVTCATGVTVDGTNDIMTFDAAGEAIVLAYKSATEWQIVLNIGAVALSQSV